jgi:hypothetical protein
MVRQFDASNYFESAKPPMARLATQSCLPVWHRYGLSGNPGRVQTHVRI